MDTFAVDFETEFGPGNTLRETTATRYVMDPRLSCYLVAVEGPGVSYVGDPAGAPWAAIAGHTWVSHNASFDAQVWGRLRHLGAVPPEGPAEWHCTADLSSWCQGPRSLRDAAAVWLGQELSKDYRKAARGKSGATLAGVKAIRDAGTADARACLAVWHKLESRWPALERDLSRWTWCWGAAGIAVDLDGLAKDEAHLTTQYDAAVADLPWVAAGEKALSPMAARRQCEREGIPAPPSFAQNDEDCAAWEDEHAADRPWIAALRTTRRVNRLRSVVRAMRARALRDTAGVARVTYGLKYCGAPHTGRWSGDAGFNVQNMPRAEMFGVDVRARLVAPPGHKLVAVDLSQIEPRVLAWLADDQEFLALVARGVDIYEAHARATMKYIDPAPLKQVDPALRSLAKARVLGLSYGASGERFVGIAKAMAGLDLTPAAAAATCRAFRASNRPITRLWDHMQGALDAANGDDLTVDLPSGRTVSYFGVAGQKARPVKGAPPERYWGSKLVENITQATAREVFAHALHRIVQEVDARILFTVHDEVVLEVPDGRADAVAAQVVAILSTTPEWLPGCPLAAEAQIVERYTK